MSSGPVWLVTFFGAPIRGLPVEFGRLLFEIVFVEWSRLRCEFLLRKLTVDWSFGSSAVACWIFLSRFVSCA